MTSRRYIFSSPERNLIAVAALLHIMLAVGVFAIGRAEIFPRLVDWDGILDSFAHDSYEYRREALRLLPTELDDSSSRPAEADHVHAKVLSVEFMVLGPLFGNSILSAEPFNLTCYLLILVLVMKLGTEIGSRRAGMIGAGIVGIWPTFLLHSIQFLKEPLFVAVSLALVFIVVTWITREYEWREALISTLALAAVSLLLLLIRVNFVPFTLLIVFLGIFFLVVRQLFERRALRSNMLGPSLIVLVAIAYLMFHPAATEKFKHYPLDQTGLNKSSTVAELATTIVFRDGIGNIPFKTRSGSLYSRFSDGARDVALKVGAARSGFKANYPDSGSTIDTNIQFDRFADVIGYLPRAMAVGLFAPFPNMWTSNGQRVGRMGRMVAGAETALMYLCELFAVAAVCAPARRLANGLLLSIVLLGVTGLSMLIPNIGMLYRVRFLFWILLIVLATNGLRTVYERAKRSPVSQPFATHLPAVASTLNRVGLILFFICVGLGAICLSAASSTNAAAESEVILDFTLTNRANSSVRGVYLSPHEAQTWEENVLGEDRLFNGELIKMKFNPLEHTTVWDLRIEIGRNKRTAEWKNLDLARISRIVIELGENDVATARVE